MVYERTFGGCWFDGMAIRHCLDTLEMSIQWYLRKHWGTGHHWSWWKYNTLYPTLISVSKPWHLRRCSDIIEWYCSPTPGHWASTQYLSHTTLMMLGLLVVAALQIWAAGVLTIGVAALLQWHTNNEWPRECNRHHTADEEFNVVFLIPSDA